MHFYVLPFTNLVSRYHFYYNPGRDQSYQLSQMIAIMAAELGIDKPARNAEQVNSTMLSHTSQVCGPVASLEEIERRRTFLGCYFLSSR